MALDNQFNTNFEPKPETPSNEDNPPQLANPDAGLQQTEGDEFKTPEEIAAVDDHTTASPILNKVESDMASKKKRSWKIKWPPTKKQWLIIAGILIVLLLLGLLGYKYFHKTPPPKPKSDVAKIVTVKSNTVASDLTGLQVDPAVNKIPVTAVMIENSPDARPQSGLGQAGVVFEAVAEGGVTRFMALYQDTAPSSLGPVRSARPYYVQWALGYDAAYAHVGGSPDALADIQAWNVKNLDEFSNGASYHRISSRAAPHNVYTSIADLNQLEHSKGYNSSTYTSWVRKKEAPSKTVTAGTINMSLSGPTYNPTYTYNAKTNSYNRSEAGAPQIDANTNTQISPKVVIAIVVPESQGALDASGAYYSNYNVIGSGTAYIFQDGTVTTGQWNKADNTTQITFTDASGNQIPLNPGFTWITAITSSSNVTYTP